MKLKFGQYFAADVWLLKLNLGQCSEDLVKILTLDLVQMLMLVEILKLMLNRDYELYEFDPDLRKNLKYELNPRVRCAPGNVLN